MSEVAKQNSVAPWNRLISFPATPYEVARMERFLRFVYSFQVVCWVLIAVLDRGTPAIASAVFQIGHALICFILFSRHRYEFARLSFPVVWLIGVSVVVGTGDGVHDVGLLAYPCLILATAYLLGRPMAALSTLLSIGALLIIYRRDVSGANVTPFAREIEPNDFIFLALILVANLGVLWFLIGEMRKDLKTAQSNAERYRLLAENVTDVVQVLGLDFRTRYVSPSIERQRGYTVEEFQARQPGEGIDPETYRRFVTMLRTEMEHDGERDPSRSLRIEVRVQRRDGSWMWVEAMITAIRDGRGEFSEILAVWRDIEERRLAEEERASMQMRMQELQRMEGLGLLAGGIAHDFNNLLAGIMGNADVARTRLPGDSPARMHIEQVLRTSQDAADLCRQLLAYSGQGKFKVRVIDLKEFFAEMPRVLALTAGRDVQLRLETDEAHPPVEVDLTQLRQIVMNLVLNAAEAMQDRKGTITLRTGARKLEDSDLQVLGAPNDARPGMFVFFEVEDDGDGMDEATRRRIFEPFFTTKPSGHGLGLAATLGIVRSHRGILHVYSEPNVGTRIRIYLPPAEGPSSPIERPVEPTSEYRGEGTVLIADDELTLRELAAAMFEIRGFTPLTAADGKEAVDHFESNFERIRLVVLDLTMPVMNGQEALGRIRAIDPRIPVILTSGFAETELATGSQGDGYTGFLQKPYRASELDDELRSALGV